MVQEVNLDYIFETEPISFARKRAYNHSTQAEHFCVDRSILDSRFVSTWSNNNEGCNVSYGGNMILKPDLPSTEKCTRCGQLMLAIVPQISDEEMHHRGPITDSKDLIASFFDMGKTTRFEIVEKMQVRPLGNRKAFKHRTKAFQYTRLKASQENRMSCTLEFEPRLDFTFLK